MEPTQSDRLAARGRMYSSRMKPMIRLGTAALGALLVVLGLGCDRKKPTRPTPESASLQTLWPNDDGRTWNYRISARWWADPGPRHYQSRDSVPPVPPLSLLAAQLGTQPIGSSPSTDTATFQLKFEGLMTTRSGVTAQRLKETVVRPMPFTTWGSAAGIGLPRSIVAAMPDGFLRHLVRARPDLARKLARFDRRALATADTIIRDPATLFLFGYAWKRTSEWIGSYGDVDTLLAWKYLTKNLTPGSEFLHRLVPSLAPDVFLRGRILERQTVQTLAGTFTDAVVCLYSVDYGISPAINGADDTTGYSRYYSYGTVAYADSVGPVASYERRLVGLGNPSLGSEDRNLVLSSRTALRLWASR
jgi:hypothetical protein